MYYWVKITDCFIDFITSISTKKGQNDLLSTSKAHNSAKYRFQIRNIVSVPKNQYRPALFGMR